MNYDTTDSILWPHDRPDTDIIECSCGCGLEPDLYDPIQINGEYYSDICAGEITRLRMPEIMRNLKLNEK